MHEVSILEERVIDEQLHHRTVVVHQRVFRGPTNDEFLGTPVRIGADSEGVATDAPRSKRVIDVPWHNEPEFKHPVFHGGQPLVQDVLEHLVDKRSFRSVVVQRGDRRPFVEHRRHHSSIKPRQSVP